MFGNDTSEDTFSDHASEETYTGWRMYRLVYLSRKVSCLQRLLALLDCSETCSLSGIGVKVLMWHSESPVKPV